MEKPNPNKAKNEENKAKINAATDLDTLKQAIIEVLGLE